MTGVFAFTRTAAQEASPIATLMAAIRTSTPTDSLLDLSQGVPAYGPPPGIIDQIVEVAMDPGSHGYTERFGMTALRAAFADQISNHYAGTVSFDNVLVTAGCNQAFCAAISALADVGDQVILTDPYYFNYDMWLRNERISPRYVACDDAFIPRLDEMEAAITSRTRAIVIVSPGNPTGATVPAATIRDFASLARRHNIALVLDETYRCFTSLDAPPHKLFQDQNWPDTVVSLHSFSKQYAIPGCRVGAAVASPILLQEMSKILDCVAICPPRLGQEAALAGILHEDAWLQDRVEDVRRCRERFVHCMAEVPGGFRLRSSGGFFGWVEHPFKDRSSREVLDVLVHRHGLLALPGEVFSQDGTGFLRFSCAAMSDADADSMVKALTSLGQGDAA